ncbi:monosaccharide ABC transporter ATP-binding protein, CUT2 family [Micromonospora citrea]|uniref:Monosaccharide ABC transporter ATP-binding protein, CUT2 family n=1 Tax=Micromonospora citrea TaxID=47855 RepID=A0A1C6VY65_9ACTN|nr:sugar ABC transporter ATP-binding protein [Micromonospora citrea]SCL71147.1 monosaccharide ABC transporter ATP-binding protein, CUT2 family [Micromonospora citrea]
MHVDNLPVGSLATPPAGGREPSKAPPVVTARQVTRTYGRTRALTGVDLEVRAGEVLGLVGHNGAGKSTLMRVLAGLEACDEGVVTVGGQEAPRDVRPGAAEFRAVRMAYQETSLCPDLTVAENIWISSRHSLPRLRWRRAASTAVRRRLDEMFPGHGVAPRDRVADLTLARRQMVEIARASLVDRLDLLILDEPTESLGPDAARSLYDHVRTLTARGSAVLLISHRIREVLSVADRVAVMRDGAVVADRPAVGLSENDVLALMGAEVAAPADPAPTTASPTGDRPMVAELRSANGQGLNDVSVRVGAGEVVGLAGLAGQGQQEVLERLWRPVRRDTTVRGSRAYVPGDRQRSGVLPLWSVAENLVVTAMRDLARYGLRRRAEESAAVRSWVERLVIRGGADAGMTELSGGNQQKVIVARAFASAADLVLLDDPFRGVDVHTKTDLYALIREEAANGRSVVWYSSENAEMAHCDRVYVLRAGRVVAELAGEEISEERIIAVSFAESTGERR